MILYPVIGISDRHNKAILEQMNFDFLPFNGEMLMFNVSDTGTYLHVLILLRFKDYTGFKYANKIFDKYKSIFTIVKSDWYNTEESEKKFMETKL